MSGPEGMEPEEKILPPPTPEQIPALLEALLFVAEEPVEVRALASVLGVDVEAIEQGLNQLAKNHAGRGLSLQRKADRVQLTTVPEAAPYIERFLGLQTSGKLSQAALETLAIIAYQQPITRASIEAIRGVNCDAVLRTLLSRGLIAEVGRLEQVGRPILYGTTFAFLQYFGLQSLEQLPPLDAADNGSPSASSPLPLRG